MAQLSDTTIHGDLNVLGRARIHKAVEDKGSLSGAINFDLNLYGSIKLTLTANSSFDLSGSYSADRMYITEVLLTNGGNYTLTWSSKFKFVGGSLTGLTTNGTDSLTLITLDGGNTCRILVNGRDIK